MSVLDPSSEPHLWLEKFKEWIETKDNFYGRKDDQFLLMFLYSCDFDLELSKKSLTLYYENRFKYSKWWADRNVKDPEMMRLLNFKAITLLIDSDSFNPSISITFLSRYGSDSSVFDNMAKLASVGVEVLCRRQNCQMNGYIAICDLANAPWWLIIKYLWPPTIKALIQSYLCAIPIKVKAFILLNSPIITTSVYKIGEPFLPQSIKTKIHIFGSDWTGLNKIVPLELLPEEFGGFAGPMQRHEDAFIAEILSLNDYLTDDNKYGFQDKQQW